MHDLVFTVLVYEVEPVATGIEESSGAQAKPRS